MSSALKSLVLFREDMIDLFKSIDDETCSKAMTMKIFLLNSKIFTTAFSLQTYYAIETLMTRMQALRDIRSHYERFSQEKIGSANLIRFELNGLLMDMLNHIQETVQDQIDSGMSSDSEN